MKAAVYTKAKTGKVLEMKDLEQPVPKNGIDPIAQGIGVVSVLEAEVHILHGEAE